MKSFSDVETKSASKASANHVASLSPLQAKMKIGAPNDKYEQEADQVAERVMTMPESNTVNRKCESCEENTAIRRQVIFNSISPLIQRQTEEEEEPLQAKPFLQRNIEKEEEHIQPKLFLQRQHEEEEEPIQAFSIQRRIKEEEEKPIQKKPLIQKQEKEEEEPVQAKQEGNKTHSSVADNSFESNLNAKRGGGNPLPESTRTFMEERIGADFSGVRVHHDSASARLSNQIQAQAFTTGKDIFFNTGKYNPDSSSGKHLLAHELTHTVQQGASVRRKQFIAKERNDQISQQEIQKKPDSGRSILVQRNVLGDIVGGVSSIISGIGRAIGAGISTATAWINNIAIQIGTGVSNAWNWVRQIAGTIGMGVIAAWNWIKNLASQVGMGIRTAVQWIIGVARLIGTGITAALQWLTNLSRILGRSLVSALGWIRNLASLIFLGIREALHWVLRIAQRIGLGIITAWNWIVNIAQIIGLGIRQAFEWIASVAQQLARNIIIAWSWLINLSRFVRTTIIAAYNWMINIAFQIRLNLELALIFLLNIARAIGSSFITFAWRIIRHIAIGIRLSIIDAWLWIQNVARRLSRSILSAWNYLKELARRFRARINQIWTWLQSHLPLIIIGNFKNSGSTSSNNLCDICPQTLGPSSADGTNGMELRGDIIGHNPLYTYDFKRTKERATWKKVGTTWSQLTHVGPRADDDSHNQDEDLIPDGNKIFVIDTPGFLDKNDPVGDNSATEAVYKASFVETAKVLKPGETWKTVSNSYNWFSISWFEKHGGSWRRKAGSNKIESGSTTVGTGNP